MLKVEQKQREQDKKKNNDLKKCSAVGKGFSEFFVSLFLPSQHLLHKYASSTFTKWYRSVRLLVSVRLLHRFVSVILTNWYQSVRLLVSVKLLHRFMSVILTFTWIYSLKFKSDFFDIFFHDNNVRKINILLISRFFKALKVLNLLVLVSKLTYVLLTSTVNSLVHIHLLKMVVLRENIVMWLRLA